MADVTSHVFVFKFEMYLGNHHQVEGKIGY